MSEALTLLYDRHLVTVGPEESTLAGAKHPITICQFNTLADTLSDAFPKVNGEFLKWEYRKDLLVAEIVRTGSHIVCLEEVDRYDEFEKALEKYGYKGILCMNGSGRMGNAMFFKKDFLDIAEQEVVLYYDEDGKECGQRALLVMFKAKVLGSSLRAVVTHLKAKPDFENLRLAQISCLLKRLEQLQAENDVPLVVLGDLNTEPSGLVYPRILSSPLGLASAYNGYRDNKLPSESVEPDAEPKYTTCTVVNILFELVRRHSRFLLLHCLVHAGKVREDEVQRTIDYIFYTRKHFSLTHRYAIPNEKDVEPTRLPGVRYPSDHFALAATLTFN